MSEPPQVEQFKGRSWDECSDFIIAVRKRAAWEGKQRDSLWMADFASPYFSQKALAWHVRLPRDVREDWETLELALVNKWSPQDDDEERERSEPAPAQAANPSQSTAPGVQRVKGVLKLMPESQGDPLYVKWNGNEKSSCGFTTNITEALHLESDCKANNVVLKVAGSAAESWLAIGWTDSTPKFETGTLQYGYLLIFPLDRGKPSPVGNGTWSILTCSVWARGELLPTWSQGNGTYKTLGCFFSPTVTGSGIYLAADPETYGAKYTSEKRVHLFFEAIN